MWKSIEQLSNSRQQMQIERFLLTTWFTSKLFRNFNISVFLKSFFVELSNAERSFKQCASHEE